ncbi:MAG: hypothetical protein ABI232_09425 [Jatrophihabitantaceae bacterium]
MSEVKWTSLVNADLLLSLRVPLGWEVQVVDELRFRVFRDPADAGDYQASVGFVLGEPEEPGADWFRRFCRAVPDELASSAEEYELIDTEEFVLSTGAKVFAVRARQHATGAPATSQSLAYVWANSYRMYVVDASTLREHERRDFPLFDQILRSIRVLPPRT